MKKNARIEALRSPAKVSQFISTDDLPPGSRVILCARVSSPSQKPNLPDQKVSLLKLAHERNWTVVAKLAGVESARTERRKGLRKLIRLAKKHKAVLVAESIDRFIRNPTPYAPTDDGDVRRLAKAAEGVQFALVNPPATSARKVRSDQTKRGQAEKQHYGGRPRIESPMKARRLALLPKVIHLHEQGWGYLQIGKQTGVATSTVRDWLRGERKSA
jgi:DNA invertase Pin-like site-specific DNA recombinase